MAGHGWPKTGQMTKEPDGSLPTDQVSVWQLIDSPVGLPTNQKLASHVASLARLPPVSPAGPPMGPTGPHMGPKRLHFSISIVWQLEKLFGITDFCFFSPRDFKKFMSKTPGVQAPGFRTVELRMHQ